MRGGVNAYLCRGNITLAPDETSLSVTPALGGFSGRCDIAGGGHRLPQKRHDRDLRDADRIELPCGGKPLKGLRDAFGKRRKITYRLDEIDSVVCWHPRSPERRHKFRPSTEVGWCWVYLETPHIGVHIYARRGYTIHTNGGISPLKASQWWGLSSTEVGIYLLKTGDTELYALGEAGRRSQDAFRERICRYIADDPALCERIRASDALRSKTVVLLRDYRPSTH